MLQTSSAATLAGALRLIGQAEERGESVSESTDKLFQEVVQAIRLHLGMEVAFLSEFKDGQRVFRIVDHDAAAPFIQVGDASPLTSSYCQRIVEGRLSQLIRDAQCEPAALELPATRLMPIGAHISVPIRFQDGRVFGTLCAFDRRGDTTLNDRDLAMMLVFADFMARQLERDEAVRQADQALCRRIRHLLETDGLRTVLQPIHDLRTQAVVGYEALSRFANTPATDKSNWFAEASKVELQVMLELQAIRSALACLDDMPESAYLSLNVSPETLLSEALDPLLRQHPLERLMLEVTEHSVVEDYQALAEALTPLRRDGLRLAIDDAGAGYASFRHILKLMPDVIKLDQSLTRKIHRRAESRALTAALVAFAAETRITLVAEGVEREEELACLRQIGVALVQGHLLGKPLSPPEWLKQKAPAQGRAP